MLLIMLNEFIYISPFLIFLYLILFDAKSSLHFTLHFYLFT